MGQVLRPPLLLLPGESMSALLWYGKGDNDAVSLGGTLHVLAAFSELAGTLHTDKRFDELQSVPGFLEQEVTPWWMGQVAQQALLALQLHGPSLSQRARSLLNILMHMPVPHDPHAQHAAPVLVPTVVPAGEEDE